MAVYMLYEKVGDQPLVGRILAGLPALPARFLFQNQTFGFEIPMMQMHK